MNSGPNVTSGTINNSFHDLKSFGKEIVKSDVFKKTEAFADDSADIISEKVRIGAEQAEKRVKEYTDVAIDFIRKNPFTIAFGVLGVSIAWGAYLLRKRG